jgi:erythromycin esterase-like protein
MGQSGEWTVGQLMRQRHDGETFLLGFSTYSGGVIAASQWGEEGREQRVRPALPGSFAALFHETGIPNFFLPLRGQSDMVLQMGEPRLERAIGVVYLPQTERQSHYFQARMSRQFDAVIYFDESTSVKPLRP